MDYLYDAALWVIYGLVVLYVCVFLKFCHLRFKFYILSRENAALFLRLSELRCKADELEKSSDQSPSGLGSSS